MFTKTIIIVAMLAILISLTTGLIYLVHDEGKTKRTLKALTWRIGISITLFIFLIIAFNFGWLKPHGL